ncbi:multidrug transporter [Peribacillus saganii]|uniref:Multidrug transporter n=1 Tax=Peribacillus saganii TaxID=2303992 RepID=A0A372LRG5_9BACI|nr:DsrE family protein [Peribacillus saganii]RFU70507.1 multidrug transporter [Peribacillus saganii]
MHLLIHLTHGPEAPTQADRAFLIAKTALKDGHKASMFLAGSAVGLIKEENLDKVFGVGSTATELRNSVNEILENGGRIVLSEVSCGARGITEKDWEGKNVELGSPSVLVEMTAACDKVITYG